MISVLEKPGRWTFRTVTLNQCPIQLSKFLEHLPFTRYCVKIKAPRKNQIRFSMPYSKKRRLCTKYVRFKRCFDRIHIYIYIYIYM